MKYQLKPEFIDVIKFTRETAQECVEFTNGELELKAMSSEFPYGYLRKYDLPVYLNNYIVKLQNGSFDCYSEHYLNSYYIPV